MKYLLLLLLFGIAYANAATITHKCPACGTGKYNTCPNVTATIWGTNVIEPNSAKADSSVGVTNPNKAIDSSYSTAHPDQWHSDPHSTYDGFVADSWWGVGLSQSTQHFLIKIYARKCCNENGSEDFDIYVANSYPANNQKYSAWANTYVNGEKQEDYFEVTKCGSVKGMGNNDILKVMCSMSKGYSYVILRPTGNSTHHAGNHYFHIPQIEISTTTTPCTNCPAGQYQEATGQSSCKSCGSGQYQDETGKNSCKSCATGRYQDETDKNSCKPCSTCHELTKELSECTATSDTQCSVCGAGQLGDGTQCVDVNECTEGTYQIFDAGTSCVGNGATELVSVDECEKAMLYLNKAYGTVESNPKYPLYEYFNWGAAPRCYANTAEIWGGFNTASNAGAWGSDSILKPVCKVSSVCDTNAQCNNTDGSFECLVYGCTDSDAFNFNPDANTNDGSCVAKKDGDFELVTSGKCTDNLRYVASYTECQTAVVSLGIRDAESAENLVSESRGQNPRGCINIPGWKPSWNTASWSSLDCGYADTQCLCVAQQPECPTGEVATAVQFYTGDGGTSSGCVCDNNICNNGQICSEVLGTFTCLCPTGFTGDNCDQCAAGFTGQDCGCGNPLQGECLGTAVLSFTGWFTQEQCKQKTNDYAPYYSYHYVWSGDQLITTCNTYSSCESTDTSDFTSYHRDCSIERPTCSSMSDDNEFCGTGFAVDPLKADTLCTDTPCGSWNKANDVAICCIEKQCTCANGEGATGAACPNHGDEKCTECTGNFMLPDCNTCNPGFALPDCNTCANGYYHNGTTCVLSCAANYVHGSHDWAIPSSSATFLKPDVTETVYGNTSSGTCVKQGYTDCYTLTIGTTSHLIQCKSDHCRYPKEVDPYHTKDTAAASVSEANKENPYRSTFMNECARGCKAANTGSSYMKIAFHRSYDDYLCFCHDGDSSWGVTARTSDAGWVAAQYQCRVCDEECPSGSYQTAPCSGSNSRVCTPCTTCDLGWHETTACTNSSNRVCAEKQCTCTNGSPATSAACPTHGDEYCTECTGNFMLPDCNTCNPGFTGDNCDQRLVYKLVDSGNCDHHGYEPILDTTKCDEAAGVFDLPDTSSVEFDFTYTDSPQGCFLRSGDAVALLLYPNAQGDCDDNDQLLCEHGVPNIECNGTGTADTACVCDKMQCNIGQLCDNGKCSCPTGFTGDNCDRCADGHYHNGTTCVPSCAANYVHGSHDWAIPSSSATFLKPDVTETVYGNTSSGTCVKQGYTDCYTLTIGTTSHLIQCKSDHCRYPKEVDPYHTKDTAAASVSEANKENPYRSTFMNECARGCKAANTGSSYMKIAFHRSYDDYLCFCHDGDSSWGVTARTSDAGWVAAEYQCAGCTDPNAVNYDETAKDDDGSCSGCKGEYYKNGDVCTACDTTCGEGKFISTACTATKNRVCTTCSNCPSGKFATGGCYGIDDTLCASLNRCAPITPVVFKGAVNNTAYTIEVGEGSSIGENVNFTVCKDFTIETEISDHVLEIIGLDNPVWTAGSVTTYKNIAVDTYDYKCVSHQEMTGTITVIDCNPCVHGICHDNTTSGVTPGEFSCKTTDGVYDANGECELPSGEDSGFTGDRCHECAKGSGHNITTGKCEECADGYVNNQVSHDAQCSAAHCAPGNGTTSDWDPTGVSDNCIPCGEHEVSPGGQGQCVTCPNHLTPNSDHTECVCPQHLPYLDGETCSLCPGGQKWDGTECVPSGCDLATPNWVPDIMAQMATENIHQYCWGTHGRNEGAKTSLSSCASACSDTPEIMFTTGSCYCMSALNEQGCTIQSDNYLHRYILSQSPSEGTCEACPGATPRWDGTQCVASGCESDEFWEQTSLDPPDGACNTCQSGSSNVVDNVCEECPVSSELITHACQCGTNECSADKYCNAEENLCSAIPDATRVFKIVEEGTCGDEGYTTILDTSLCNQAATALDIYDKTASTDTGDYKGQYPAGCVTRLGASLTLYTISFGDCGPNGYYCLCSRVISSNDMCPNTHGNQTNACFCGNDECGANQYCTEGVGCHADERCTNRDGTEENTAACQCGTSECNADEYCNGELDVCGTEPGPKYEYHKVISGTCESNNYTTIFSPIACEQAALELELQDTLLDTSVENDGYINFPRPLGCYVAFTRYLYINNRGNTGACSSRYECLCGEVISAGVPGCTVSNAVNYDATATVDDDSCQCAKGYKLEEECVIDTALLTSKGETSKQNRLDAIRGEGNAPGSEAARNNIKLMLNAMARSKPARITVKTDPGYKSRKDYVKETRVEYEKKDLKQTTIDRLDARGKDITRVFHSMGPQNKDDSPNCTNTEDSCCHIDFSNQTATDLQIIEPDEDVGSWVVACNGDEPQCMQTREANGFLMQAYTGTGWVEPGDTKSEGDVHQCGSNVVVIGSMEGICGSNVDCLNGGTCNIDGTCSCTAGWCGESCESAIPAGDCDCNGNVLDCAGECGGTAEEDTSGTCCMPSERDVCGVCNGDGSSCAGCVYPTCQGCTPAQYINAQCCQCA